MTSGSLSRGRDLALATKDRTDAGDRAVNTGEEEFLTEKQVASLLELSARTLQAWRVRGLGPPHIRMSSRCLRYRRSDIDRWIVENLRRSTSDPGSRGSGA